MFYDTKGALSFAARVVDEHRPTWGRNTPTGYYCADPVPGPR
ncbi:hypothetical protein [Allomesorhizobium camelthorni]